jgi:hypothetical protein
VGSRGRRLGPLSRWRPNGCPSCRSVRSSRSTTSSPSARPSRRVWSGQAQRGSRPTTCPTSRRRRSSRHPGCDASTRWTTRPAMSCCPSGAWSATPVDPSGSCRAHLWRRSPEHCLPTRSRWLPVTRWPAPCVSRTAPWSAGRGGCGPPTPCCTTAGRSTASGPPRAAGTRTRAAAHGGHAPVGPGGRGRAPAARRPEWSGASTFYAMCGYAEVGRIPGAIRVAPGDDRDDIMMARRVDGRPLVADGGS